MKRKVLIVFMAILLLSSLIACGSNKDASYTGRTSYAASEAYYESPMEVAGDSYYDYEMVEEAKGVSSNDVDTSYVDLEHLQKGAKIIYSGNVVLETKEYDKDKKELQALIKQYNCLIDNQDESNRNTNWYYSSSSYVGRNSNNRVLNINFRVPVEQFDSFVADLNALNSHVTRFSINSNDVTRTYNQNNDRIESLETQQARLLEMMSQANSVTELLEIESRLSDISYQLKSLNNRNNDIDYDVQYSPFYVTLTEVEYYQEVEPPTYGERFKNSISESWEQFVEFFEDLSIVLVFAVPFLIVIAIIVVIIIVIVKSSKAKKRKRLALEREKAKAANLIKESEPVANENTEDKI